MSIYKCDNCEFMTVRSLDMERHNKTKKHFKNMHKFGNFNIMNMPLYDIFDDDYFAKKMYGLPINHINGLQDDKLIDKNANYVKPKKIYICSGCDEHFAHKQSLWRHKKHRCKGKQVNESKVESNPLNTEIMNIVAGLQNELNEVKQQNKQLLELATNNSQANVINAKSTKKSMNMMSHAMKHWSNAPPIKQLEGNEAMKLITFENKSKHPIEEVVIHQFNSGTLYRFLGNVLIKEFKKEDEVDQSLWTTDSARLCFIIKQIVGDEGGDRWIADKSGIEITKLLISPLVNRVIEMMNDYSKKCAKEVSDAKDNEKSKISMERMHDAGSLIRGIVKNDLRKKILQYIAPYFNINIKNIELQKV